MLHLGPPIRYVRYDDTSIHQLIQVCLDTRIGGQDDTLRCDVCPISAVEEKMSGKIRQFFWAKGISTNVIVVKNCVHCNACFWDELAVYII